MTNTERLWAVVPTRWVNKSTLYRTSGMCYYNFTSALEALKRERRVERAIGRRKVGKGGPAHLYRRVARTEAAA